MKRLASLSPLSRLGQRLWPARRARAGRRGPVWAVAAAWLVILVVSFGCGTEEKRYRLLSFFFDGVPVPESLRGELGESPSDSLDPRRATTQRAAAKPIEYVYHRPYAQRDCFACHDRDQGFRNVADPTQLCGACHRSYFTRLDNDWMHGPAMLGQCALCHRPHKSQFEGLLTSTQPTLCYTCHEQAWFADDPFHRRLEDQTCSNCHDPHAAGNHKLLGDARTYRRNRNAAQRVGVRHPDWSVQQCSLCHVTAESNRLINDVDAVCLTCHREQQQGPAGVKLHQPVADGKCVTCHTPHKSVRPHLVRAQAEQLCIGCHELEKVNTPSHPKVTRVDCTLCHEGHHAQREHLLRPGVGLSAEEDPPPPVPDDATPAPAAPDPEGQP